jgi:hypothetical protein
MSHTEKIWIIVGIASFAGTIGLLVGLREIIYRVNSIPIHNRLRRNHGDIELNYIEPAQPAHAYQPIDLVNLNYEPYNWSDRLPSYYTGQHAPSYYSGGNPPSFNTIDRINCCLENENIINLYFISLIFIIMFFLIIFFKINSLYSISLMIPFSTFEIDFRDSFEWKFNSYKDKPTISYLKVQTLTEDIIKLLHSLNDDVQYSMSLSFISSYKKWKDNKEKLDPFFIDDAIIVNKESDPVLIT